MYGEKFELWTRDDVERKLPLAVSPKRVGVEEKPCDPINFLLKLVYDHYEAKRVGGKGGTRPNELGQKGGMRQNELGKKAGQGCFTLPPPF